MLKIRETIGEAVGETIATVFGWLVCLAVSVGAYSLGVWAAPHLGWAGNHGTAGLLTSLMFIWMYEHRVAQERYDRLCDLIGHRLSK